MALFMFETTSTFCLRYCVNADNIEDAKKYIETNLDSDKIKEFSQQHISEIVIDKKEISTEEYFSIFNIDNDYLKSWTNEQKMNFINDLNKPKCEDLDCCEICL